MPTPDLKSKEMIYWIRINTSDRRLVTDLQRFLEAPSQHIELHVPSAFIAVKAELESYRPSGKVSSGDAKRRVNSKLDSERGVSSGLEEESQEPDMDEDKFLFEIILRRKLSEPRHNQLPYG